MITFGVRIDNGVEPKLVKAAKLELGPVQTLAHKEGDTWVLNDPPPDKVLELMKCQRYYCQSWNGSNLAWTSDGCITKTVISSGRIQNVEFPVTMRANPAITIFTHEGTNMIPGQSQNG